MTEAVLAALIISPVLLTYFLKSNAALGFLALCAGFVLSTSVIGELKQLLSQMNLSVTNSTLAITLLVLPLGITLLITKRANIKGFKRWLQLLVALLGGGLLALSVAPLINAGWFDLSDSAIWDNLLKIQAGVVGAGAFLSFVLVWIGSKSNAKKH
jgi:hypothetical protein